MSTAQDHYVVTMIAYIKTIKNIADILTKQLAGPQLAQYRDYALGIHDTINIVTAAVAEILCRICIDV